MVGLLSVVVPRVQSREGECLTAYKCFKCAASSIESTSPHLVSTR